MSVERGNTYINVPTCPHVLIVARYYSDTFPKPPTESLSSELTLRPHREDMAGTNRIWQSPANPPSYTPRSQGSDKIMSTLPSNRLFISCLDKILSLRGEATNTSSISATSTRALRESQTFPSLSDKLQLVRAQCLFHFFCCC